MTWTLDDIRELIKVVTDTGVAELEVQRGDERVRIRRSSAVHKQQILVPAQAVSSTAGDSGQQQVMVAQPQPSAVSSTTVATPVADQLADPTLVTVKSPIVGTFYEASSPEAPPFVKVGDTVHSGQVLCIIESMKLMNEIESEVSGVIVSRLITNAQPVEYGESLFVIRPL